jgi:hypothetical protein
MWKIVSKVTTFKGGEHCTGTGKGKVERVVLANALARRPKHGRLKTRGDNGTWPSTE